MIPGLPIDGPLIQGLLSTSRTLLGTPHILNEVPSNGLVESSKFDKSWSQSRHQLSESRNQIFVVFSKMWIPGATDLRLGCSWA